MKFSMVASTLILACTSSLAFAHGEEVHAKKTFNSADAEQKEFGIAEDPQKPSKTVRIDMDDNMRFTPNNLTIMQGETVTFIVTNKGKIMHEMVLGTMSELQKHAELMKKFPNMEHEELHMAHVKPGADEKIVWNFNKPGDFDFGCLVAGHFEAGMAGKIKVIGKDSLTRSH